MSKREEKARLVRELGQRIENVASTGRLSRSTKPQPIVIDKQRGIVGPRAGAVEFGARLDSGKLLQALSKDECANLRTLIPWDFTSDPVVYMRGRFVRCEAGWPPHLADKVVRLSEANARPEEPWRWLAGKDEMGGTIRPGLYDATSHWLMAGTTGSGKSVAMRVAILQLCQSAENRIALVDGKWAESLGAVSHLPGVLGPVATDLPAAKAVLMWACKQMRQRYEMKWQGGRLVIAIDEFQEFTRDAIFVDLLRKLASQGRGAGVHLLLSTQHPALETFNDVTIRRNVTGRIALKTADYDASKVATGSNAIRSDLLLGAGDAYVITPAITHRTQLFFADGKDFEQEGPGQHEIEDWLALGLAPEDVGQDLPTPKRGTKKCFAVPEVGTALISAVEGEGRPTMEGRMVTEGLAKPGSDRAYRLHCYGKDLYQWLEGHNYAVESFINPLS